MASESGAPFRAVLFDWGGVLTTNLFDSFRAFCEREGLLADTVRDVFMKDPLARELLVDFECGRIAEPDFERQFGAILEVRESAGLVDRMFAGMGPDAAMIDVVRQVRAAGVPVGLVSNSWGMHRYPREVVEDLFDGTVFSGEVGIRKPSRRIYELGAEAIGVAPAACVFVDDIEHNLVPARELGMGAVLHRDAASSARELSDLIGVELRA